MIFLKKSMIIPTIFSYNKAEFDEKFKKLIRVSKKLQIDLMDGFFVSKKSVSPKFIPNLLKYNNFFEVHLMVKNPVSFFEKIKGKGFKKVIFHLECFKSVCEAKSFFVELKKQKFIPVLAVNPSTKLTKKIMLSFDFFLLMGVNPGAEGQKIKRSVYNKIALLKKHNPKAKIQIDGGVTPKNASKLFKLGVNYINSGAYISGSDNPAFALESFINKKRGCLKY